MVQPSPPPIITSQGIFLVYNGTDDNLVSSTGWVLFGNKAPSKVLGGANKYASVVTAPMS